MKYQSAQKWLIPLIGLLALFAAGMGLFYQTDGQPYSYTNHRGETVMINGRGLYRYDTVSTVAQMQANDGVTLLIGLPLLAISSAIVWRRRSEPQRPNVCGSIRGRLLLTGTLGFFLYTYLSMAMLTAYNELFLVYVTLLALSLYAFVLGMLSFDLAELPAHFSERLPRRVIAGVLFVIGGFLALAWVGRIVPEMWEMQNAALENTTTRVIQAMDLALLAPLAVLAGVLLLRRDAWGYLLTSVFIMKAITMGLAVSAMGLNMMRQQVPDSLGIVVPFLVITAVNLVVAVLLFKNIDSAQKTAATAA